MKKSKKIALWVVTGAIIAGVAGTLLGIFIPKLFTKSKIDSLVQEQVIPSKGDGNFLKYQINPSLESDEIYNKKLESIEQFSKESLKSETGFNSVMDGLVSNYIVEFWKNYKLGSAYTERFKDWDKKINEEWDNTVKDYKNKYGDDWEFYFQLEVLDPVGGNEDDWKRNKIIAEANTAFDEFMFTNYYINPLNKSGTDVITNFEKDLPKYVQEYLVSPDLVNGAQPGERNKILFQPSKSQMELNKYSLAQAKFQEFVFMEWVKDELPLITSMTLWKHGDPTTLTNNGYDYFNIKKADEIYNGQYTSNAPAFREGEEVPPEGGDTGGDTGGGDTTTPSGAGIASGYKWQAYPAKSTLVDNPSGEISGLGNATDKYLKFAEKFNGGKYADNFMIKDTGGINIPVKYTDDSSTLYFIKLSGGAGSVFNTSYTQYAAGATFKFNEILGITDANVPKNSSKNLNVDPVVANTSGTEIMKNFLSNSKAAGYIELPKQVLEILKDDANYNFKGLYNGITAATDTVNMEGTPFILTRNESGVHIIGIDRYDKIKAASTYEGKINEIANTLLWRYILTISGMNDAKYLNNGFTSFDLKSEIKNYYTNNRNSLLFKYIVQNEKSAPSDKKEYIFSDEFTSIDKKMYFTNNESMVNYVYAWLDYKKYLSRIGHDANVESKILDLQTSKNSLTYKTFGNTVIQNGIAAMQPYTRDTTKNATPTRENSGYVDDVHGTYASLSLYEDFNTSKRYTNTNLLKLKKDIDAKVNALYSSLSPEIQMKNLTYVSAKYNQYLLIGSKNPTSNRYYADNCDILNNAISTYISSNSENIKNIINIQRLLGAVNSTDIGNEQKASSNNATVLDIKNLALEGTYTSTTDITTSVPSVPSNNDASNKDFVNYYLQSSFDVVNKLSLSKSQLANYQDGLEYNDVLKLSRELWVTELLQDEWSSKVLDYIKQVIGLKYAFDYNPTTGQYEFTKFRNYLVEQTQNNKKAAFVWVKDERNDLVTGYNTQTRDKHFEYKKQQVSSIIDVNGYIYQNAPGITNYKADTGLFKDTVTFASNNSYSVVAPVEKGKQGYVGYQGMVFESSSSSNDLPSEAKSAMFSTDELNVFLPDTDKLTAQGEMYNIGSRQNLINEVRNGINNWTNLNQAQEWLQNRFGIETENISSYPQLSDAVNELCKIIETDTTNIPDSLFTRNKNVTLATSSSLFNESSKYFGNIDSAGSKLSEVVFTQFNYEDVVQLFDTNNDKILDSNDKGINWAVANDPNEQFLGTSAEAFFIAAMQWFNSQSSYITTATNDIQEKLPKFEAYDRRLNNLFGEDYISNYKKETSQK